MAGDNELPHTPLSHGDCCQLSQSTFLVFHCFGLTPVGNVLQGVSPQMALLHLLLFYTQQRGQTL